MTSATSGETSTVNTTARPQQIPTEPHIQSHTQLNSHAEDTEKTTTDSENHTSNESSIDIPESKESPSPENVTANADARSPPGPSPKTQKPRAQNYKRRLS
ncbi:hypothetical protein DID88_000226 [Monilinia fructigena]|uniref:Uncharacterized protein n=1 Tax=Monilinia fructigena TaxID=38457 RepID=A0A395IJV8_9HELO|nr:hypothetical protein DID88_000226 [Monilinia fructigena]